MSKRIKTTQAAERSQQAAPFERFAKAMRALMAVPKREVDEMLAKEKAEKRAKHRSSKPG